MKNTIITILLILGTFFICACPGVVNPPYDGEGRKIAKITYDDTNLKTFNYIEFDGSESKYIYYVWSYKRSGDDEFFNFFSGPFFDTDSKVKLYFFKAGDYQIRLQDDDDPDVSCTVDVTIEEGFQEIPIDKSSLHFSRHPDDNGEFNVTFKMSDTVYSVITDETRKAVAFSLELRDDIPCMNLGNTWTTLWSDKNENGIIEEEELLVDAFAFLASGKPQEIKLLNDAKDADYSIHGNDLRKLMAFEFHAPKSTVDDCISMYQSAIEGYLVFPDDQDDFTIFLTTEERIDN